MLKNQNLLKILKKLQEAKGLLSPLSNIPILGDVFVLNAIPLNAGV